MAATTLVQTSVVDEVRQTLLSLDPQAQLVLFGFRARKQQHGVPAPTDSDWDFLVLTSNNATEAWIREFVHNDKAETMAISRRSMKVLLPGCRKRGNLLPS